MDAQFWQKKWFDGQIGFHEAQPHPMLLRHWPGLSCPEGTRVLVPLCGKSHDLLCLRDFGCEVIGIELSNIAVDDFFRENEIQATISDMGDLRRYESPGLTLYCGDFFNLDRDELGSIDAIYDRAALIALPQDMRKSYSTHLSDLAPNGCVMLLITVDYDQSIINPPPFVVSEEEVSDCYATEWSSILLDSVVADVKGEDAMEHVFKLVKGQSNGQ